MGVKETLEVKELRLRIVPLVLHEKIEKYIAKVLVKDGRHLNKETASIELLAKATEKI